MCLCILYLLAMRQSFSNEDLNVLFKLIASQFLSCGYGNLSKELFKEEDQPYPSNWLIHLVMVGRDVLGITGFNFAHDPVTPYTSFVNSLQPMYPEMGFNDRTTTELVSPSKDYLTSSARSDATGTHSPPQKEQPLSPHSPPSPYLTSEKLAYQKLPYHNEVVPDFGLATATAEDKEVFPEAEKVSYESGKPKSVVPPIIEDTAIFTFGSTPKSKLTEGTSKTPKPSEDNGQQFSIINVENRSKRRQTSKIGIIMGGGGGNSSSKGQNESKTKDSSESLQNEIKTLNSKLSHIVTVIDGEISQITNYEHEVKQLAESSPLFIETSSRLSGDGGDCIPSGLVIEELEPITTDKRKTRKRAPRKKERSKGRGGGGSGPGKDTTNKSEFNNPAADPSQAGETEMLSDLQRVLTSDIMSSTSRAKSGRKGRSSPSLTDNEQVMLLEKMSATSSSAESTDVTVNTKLLTELQRLLTQNNIRTALNEEKKQNERRKKLARPSLDSPPYIRPPHDTTSQDGANLDFKKFPCSQCNKEFKTKQCLKRHIGRHLGVKPYACSFCKKRFNDKTNLKRHENVHRDLRKHVCDVCPQAFFRKEEMEKHKRVKHTIPDDIMRCKFNNCEFHCNLPSKLVEHIQTVHFGNYRYNCDKCRFRTQSITNYNKHLRVHTNERPFKCPKCGKGFKQWNGLNVHMNVHLKKNHICEICLKTFNLEQSLKSHYDRNHGPRAALKKLKEKRKREILQKYRERRNYHCKNLSFVVSSKV